MRGISSVLLPAAGRFYPLILGAWALLISQSLYAPFSVLYSLSLQLFHLIFTEPGVHLLGHPCILHLFVFQVTFLMMPLEIGWNVTVSWVGGDLLCRVCAFFRIFGLFLSSNIVMCMSIDR